MDARPARSGGSEAGAAVGTHGVDAPQVLRGVSFACRVGTIFGVHKIVPDSSETKQAGFSELARNNLVAVARELIAHGATILDEGDDTLTFRVIPRSIVERVFPWTRTTYRVHCVGANVHLSEKGRYHDLAHGSLAAVVRDIHTLLKR